jgi:hypothetical protein
MRQGRYGGKVEWRAQVFLAPYDVTRANVDAPNFTVPSVIREPSNHSTLRTAKIQYAISFLEEEISRIEEHHHFIDISFSAI